MIAGSISSHDETHADKAANRRPGSKIREAIVLLQSIFPASGPVVAGEGGSEKVVVEAARFVWADTIVWADAVVCGSAVIPADVVVYTRAVCLGWAVVQGR
jgi:hypothetical protein